LNWVCNIIIYLKYELVLYVAHVVIVRNYTIDAFYQDCMIYRTKGVYRAKVRVWSWREFSWLAGLRSARRSCGKLMTTARVTQILKELGWNHDRDEVGDDYAFFHLPDRMVRLTYTIINFREVQQLEFSQAVSTEAFSRVCRDIRGRGGHFSPLGKPWEGMIIRLPEILVEHVRQASEEAILWAMQQDLDAALKDYCELSTRCVGPEPVWHLAALALRGHLEKLGEYRVAFENGDRLGFVSYVTMDYIDRALAIAKREAAPRGASVR
jgi:hypothetical protein